MPIPPPEPHASDDADERDFYRAELAGRVLVLAVDPGATPAGEAALRATLAELAAAGARAVVVRAPSAGEATAVMPPDLDSLGVLTGLWASLRAEGLATLTPTPDTVEGDDLGVARVAARLAARLGVHKLVLTHQLDQPEVDTPGFIDLAELDRRPAFGAEPWSALVGAARDALEAGVGSVNLCHLEDLEQELFTYEGAGVLVTSEAYLEVGPLRVDDFDAVDRLLRQGQAEGYLRPRTDAELARFLFIGFGARLATSGHLAGVGGLETEAYAADRCGEVVGLYAISRFVGEGVGRQLVGALVDHGARLGLVGVFAVTASSQVVGFFERCGFVVVPHARVPTEKWEGYDADRRVAVTALWHDLSAG